MSEISSDTPQGQRPPEPEASIPRRLLLKGIVLGAAALTAKEIIPKIPKDSVDTSPGATQPIGAPKMEDDLTHEDESTLDRGEVHEVISGLLSQLHDPQNWQEGHDADIPGDLLTVHASEQIKSNGPTRMSSITYIAHGSDLIVEAYQGRGDDELQEQQASVAMSITVPGIGVNPLENGLPHSFSELRDFLGIMGERPQGIQVGIVSVGYAEAGRWTEAYIESQTDEADMFTVADTNGASKLGYFNQRAEKTLRTIDGKDLFLPA